MPPKVIITGGTGFIGRSLIDYLQSSGYEPIVLSRGATKVKNINANVLTWDAESEAGWVQEANGAHAIINLAGENISSGRWTKKRKRIVIESRINAAKAVISALEKVDKKPKVIIQPSGIGYYGNRGDEILDESSSIGTGYLTNVAKQWEQSIKKVESMDIRLVTIRIGVVLARGGGFLSRVLLPFRLFVGGHLGSGKQWLSWIHIADLIEAIQFLMENENLSGVFNLSAPNPLKYKDFFKILGNVTNRPSWLSVPGFALKLILGEMAQELILSGQRALPKRLLDAGYEFKFSDPEKALEDILK